MLTCEYRHTCPEGHLPEGCTVSCELGGENGSASPQPEVLPTYRLVQNFLVTEPRVREEYETTNSSDYGSVSETQDVLKTANPFIRTVTPRSICCVSAPSIHRTDRENTRVHVLNEIKPWFQYMIILTHVRVGIKKRQAGSSFNKETSTSNIYSWFQICRYWEAMPTADQWVGRNKSIFTSCLSCYKCKTGFIFTHLMIIPFSTGVSLVAQAILELLILLPRPPSVEITDKGRAPHQRWRLSCWVGYFSRANGSCQVTASKGVDHRALPRPYSSSQIVLAVALKQWRLKQTSRT